MVVSDDIAYVTLSGGNCWRSSTVNELDIIDIRDPENPVQIKTASMWHPTGLGIDGNRLFVCDDDVGLKVFDVNVTEVNATRDVTVRLIDTVDVPDCYDVIPHNDLLIVSAGESIRQFDYSQMPMQEKAAIK